MLKDSFVGNIFDPRRRGHISRNISSELTPSKRKEALDWLNNYIDAEIDLGPPVGTKTYTSEELSKMGYVGMYYKRPGRSLDDNFYPNIVQEIDFSKISEDDEVAVNDDSEDPLTE